MNEHVIIHKTHTTPLPGDNVWLEFFQHSFTSEQAALLTEMLRGCGTAWRRDWEKCVAAAYDVLFDKVQKAVYEINDDVSDHRDTLLELRAKVDVLLALSNKITDGAAIEIPKFVNGKAVVQKKAPESDVLVDRIYDVEKLAARIERQIKNILHRLSTDKSHLVAQAMVRTLTKRVETLEAQIKHINEVECKRVDDIEEMMNAVVRR